MNTRTFQPALAALLSVCVFTGGSVAGPDAPDPVAQFGAAYAEQLRQPVLLADALSIDALSARLTLLAAEAPVDAAPVLALLPAEDPDDRALAFSGRAGLRDTTLLREGLAFGALLSAGDAGSRARLIEWIEHKQDALHALAPDVRAPLHAMLTAARAGQLDARELVRALHAALGDLGTEPRANTWFIAGAWAGLARLHAARGQPSPPLAMLGEALAAALRSAAPHQPPSAADAALAEQLDRIATELRRKPPSLTVIDDALPRLANILPERFDDLPGLRHYRFTDDCKALAKLPRAADDDRVTAAREAFRVVLRVFARVNPGFTIDAAFLAPDARLTDAAGTSQPLAPIPATCSTTATVYVPYTLVERVFGDPPPDLGPGERRYPPDFFAFVIAHELAHHLERRPGARDAFSGDRGDAEVLADRRAAFYSRLAGYSPTAVWRDDLVRALLLWDHAALAANAPDRVVAERHRALRDQLDRFAAYDDAYQAARLLDLAGERGPALRLLEWLDHGPLAIPEVALTRATLLIRRAARHAPWAAALDGIGEGQVHIPCQTFDPLHTALHDPERDQLAGAGNPQKRGQARDDLDRADSLLELAARRGASPFAIATARACIAAYRGDAAPAADHQRAAERALPIGLDLEQTAALKTALDGNRAFVEWITFLAATPLPPGDNAPALEGWARHLEREVPRFTAHPAVQRLAAALQRLPDDPRIRPLRPPVETLDCPSPGGAPTSAPPLDLPARARADDPCPAGWRWRRSIPAIGATERGPLDGVTICVPDDGRRGDRLVFVALPTARATVRLQSDGGDGIDRWACHGRLQKAGVDDRGWTAWRLRRGATEVLLADGERRVQLRAAVRDDGEGE